MGKFLSKKLFDFNIAVNPLTLVVWLSSIWLFVSIIITITFFHSHPQGTAAIYSFGTKSHPYGDFGIIVILTTFVSFFSPTIIKNNRFSRLFSGMIIFMFSFVAFIGTLVSKASAATFLAWTIPLLLNLTASSIWLLQAIGIFDDNRFHAIRIKPMKNREKTTDKVVKDPVVTSTTNTDAKKTTDAKNTPPKNSFTL